MASYKRQRAKYRDRTKEYEKGEHGKNGRKILYGYALFIVLKQEKECLERIGVFVQEDTKSLSEFSTWISVLSPFEQTFMEGKPYIWESYEYAKEKFKKCKK